MNGTVFHARYGKGRVTGCEAGRVTVEFEDESVGSRKFPYPEAFENFLCYEDDVQQAKVQELLRQKKVAVAAARQAYMAEENRRTQELAAAREAQLKLQRRQAAALRRKAKTATAK